MLLFEIPDIRLFWTEDPRFLGQFTEGRVTKFKSFSKYPVCWKDISFWSPNHSLVTENDFCELVREVAGSLVEKVELRDCFEDKSNNRSSLCFRVHYRSLERTLTNEEIDGLQFSIREQVVNKLHVQLR